jgi:hypothetical protein
MSDLSPRLIYRVAQAIHGRLGRRPVPIMTLPLAAWDRCQEGSELLQKAVDRGWTAAASACRDRLRHTVNELRWQLESFGHELAEPPARTCSVREVYDDLAALASEFRDVHFDLAAQSIALTTAPVTLEGIYLGPFSILLEWDEIGRTTPDYRIIAQEECSASADAEVTHPHVRDERLCEGEGAAPIRRALAEGRILDFFTIVAQTLATYNAESAFVPLERWQGVACGDCGYTATDDDRTSCEHCEDDLCCDCSTGCSDCGRTLCSGCSHPCAGCSESHCESCLKPCTDCRKAFCEGCLNEECFEECRPEDQEESEGTASDLVERAAHSADATADALGVGQAAVPA